MPYALADFPLLSDCAAEIWRKLDQPEDETGQLTWDPDIELNQAFRSEFRYLWDRISALDRSWGVKVSTVSVTAGTRAVVLPTDCHKIREVWELRGDKEDINHASGRWDQLGQAEYTFKYRPDLRELYYLKSPTASVTLRIVYYYTPPELFHSRVQEDGTRVGPTGTTYTYTGTLGSQESTENGRLVGRDAYAYGGTGAPGIGAVTAWNGVTKQVTVTVDTSDSDYSDYGSAWDGTTLLTCRPELPKSAYDAFIYGCCARLLDKLDDDGWRIFEARRERSLAQLATDVMQLEMTDPIQTNDSTSGSHGDPLDEFYS